MKTSQTVLTIIIILLVTLFIFDWTKDSDAPTTVPSGNSEDSKSYDVVPLP